MSITRATRSTLPPIAAELNKKYRAIVAAGLPLQADDPLLADIIVEPHRFRSFR
jgi:hypothetical protein